VQRQADSGYFPVLTAGVIQPVLPAEPRVPRGDQEKYCNSAAIPHNDVVDAGNGLVGRQAEVARLSRVLTGATARAVAVSGEAGVGKTALLDQISANAVADGWQVVPVLGSEAEQPFALGGLNQMVFGLQDFLAAVDERDRAVLAPVLGGDPDSALSVLPLVVALLNLLAAAARSQPVLLMVDDVHWLDSVSAEVLGALGRRLAQPRVGIVVGRRTPNESEFSTTGWTELELGPLDAESSAQLLSHAGVPLSAATRTKILTAAAGNPLALAELPRGADQLDDAAGTLPLTERLVAVFGRRLGQLDAGVRADLLRAALDGMAVGAPATNRARYLVQNVEPALEAGLLVMDPLGDIAFRHPLVRAAVIHQAGPQERRDAHRDLAALYDDVLVRRATHLAAAATGPDQEVADLLARAAQLSIRRGGLAVAAEWLRRAGELGTDPEGRAALFADAVYFASRAGQPTETPPRRSRCFRGDPALRRVGLADAYLAFHGDGEVTSTHRRLLDVLARADTLDDETVNRLVNLLLSITNYADDAGRRRQTNDALEKLEARVDPVIMMYRTGVSPVADTAGTVRSLLNQYVERLPLLEPRRVMQLAFPAYCIDAMTEFRAPLNQAFTQVCEHGPSIDAMAMGCVVMLDLMAAGHWEQAAKVGASGLEMAQQAQGGELLRHHFLSYLGVLAASRGDLATARRHAAEVTEWSRPRGLEMYLFVAQRITVRVALAEADYEAAYQAAITISPAGQFSSNPIQVGDDMLDLVDAAVHTGRLEEARAHAAAAVELRLPEVSPRVAALTLAISAMTASDAEAGELYESALTHPGIDDFPFEKARIALAHGMWLRRERRHTKAREVLERAAESFDRLGARPWADRARAELRAAGATAKRSLGEPLVLSAQERRIADLAAAGATTRDIAAQLSLSPRTVDAHLYRIYPKLGITRRAGLSEALRQHDSALGVVNGVGETAADT
jgi:DNA-binding CsgD family transcriptional regulator